MLKVNTLYAYNVDWYFNYKLARNQQHWLTDNATGKAFGMTAKYEQLGIQSDDFTRRIAMRGQHLMWFLGAGVSAAAGVPTAMDMIWDFRQLLFATQRRAPLSEVADLSNPVVLDRLQGHIDSLYDIPAPGDPNEYAALFEKVYPSESDRRAYLGEKLSKAKPSYGHMALATLLKARRAGIVWTTNFDPLVADACAKVYGGTGNLTTADLESPNRALQAIQEERWPVEVKLHGDFRSRRLKNTPAELRTQDTKLGQTLVHCCQQYGLVVAGYSGRDDSVMDSLERAIAGTSSFPAGLFWLHRGDNAPLPRVARLLHTATERSIEAAIVSIESFDEVMRDLIRLVDDLDKRELDAFAQERRIWSPALIPAGHKGTPVIRLNALPILQSPTVCRRVVCEIGGTAEVRKAVKHTGVDVIATRSQNGVLAFGSDADVRTAFGIYGIKTFDLHTLELKRQRYDSTERGLLREALTRALERQLDLVAVRRRRSDLLMPNDPTVSRWSNLQKLVGALAGTVKGHPELTWNEGVSIRLDWANDRLWMLFEPRTVFEGLNDTNRHAAADFARERSVKRYNKEFSQLLDFWSNCFAQGDGHFRALSVGNGVDAEFQLSERNAGSRRVVA